MGLQNHHQNFIHEVGKPGRIFFWVSATTTPRSLGSIANQNRCGKKRRFLYGRFVGKYTKVPWMLWDTDSDSFFAKEMYHLEFQSLLLGEAPNLTRHQQQKHRPYGDWPR